MLFCVKINIAELTDKKDKYVFKNNTKYHQRKLSHNHLGA